MLPSHVTQAALPLLARVINATNGTTDNSTSSNSTSTSSTTQTTSSNPDWYKAIGIALACTASILTATSYVLKKKGLVKSEGKYGKKSGEGLSYLKDGMWWAGLLSLTIGEVCNFAAYTFASAIIVTPLGAISIVVTAVLSAWLLKERLNTFGMIGCALCIVGSVQIAINAPQTEDSGLSIDDTKNFIVQPGFLVFFGLILLLCLVAYFWAGPKWGKKYMLVYLTPCSWLGAFSVLFSQGVGGAITNQTRGIMQLNNWFFYVLLVLIIASVLTNLFFLNKLLSLFNVAVVTPTFYVYFTSATLISTAILYRGFGGATASAIGNVIIGFVTICSGVVLLQLSKSGDKPPISALSQNDEDKNTEKSNGEPSEASDHLDEPKTSTSLDEPRDPTPGSIMRRFSKAREEMEEKSGPGRWSAPKLSLSSPAARSRKSTRLESMIEEKDLGKEKAGSNEEETEQLLRSWSPSSIANFEQTLQKLSGEEEQLAKEFPGLQRSADW